MKHSRRENVDGWLIAATVIVAGAGFWIYLYALLRVVPWESAYEECTMRRSGGYSDGSEFGRFMGLDDGIFPPKAVCRWEDGFAMNQVPAWTNPLLLALAAVLVVLISVLQIRRQRVCQSS